MKMNNLLLAAALTAAAVVTAFAIPAEAKSAELPPVLISSGQDGGTYAKFMAQVSDVCHDEVQTKIQLSPGGSEMNVDRLEANEVSVAPVQGDYLYLASQTQDLSNLKTALVLFPEQVHFVALVQSKHLAGGKWGTSYGQQPIQLNTISDLGPETTVVASGGGKVTARLIKQWANLGYNVVEAPDAKTALNMMLSGKVDAAVVVGAKPMDMFRSAPADIKSQIKFLAIPEAILPALKSYSPDKVGYPGIQGGSAVQTVAVQSLLVTQNYGKKSPLASSVYALKKCISDHAEEQAGMPGSHPAWGKIKLDATPKWPAWDYEPTAAAQAAPVKRTKK